LPTKKPLQCQPCTGLDNGQRYRSVSYESCTFMKMIKTQGVSIARLGFGTFRMPGAEAQPVVESAIALGFRHIDTAAMYDNEAAVGAAIAFLPSWKLTADICLHQAMRALGQHFNSSCPSTRRLSGPSES
jgi:hypothetical protein